MLVLLFCLLVATLVVLGGVLWLRRPDRWLSKRTTRRVVIHTTDGQSIQGLLVTVAPDGVVLAAALYLDGPGADPVQMGGTLFLPRDKIGMVQIEGGEIANG